MLLVSLCRKNLGRFEKNLLRFYGVNSRHAGSDDDEILSENFNVSKIRSESDKSLRFALLGLPNVGKSTIINQLTGRHICAMSNKAHTTRSKAQVIYSKNDTQLIFVDTPGLVTNRDFTKFKLEPTFKSDINASLKTADLVGVVHDTTHAFKACQIDERVIAALKLVEGDIPSILILNKIDKVTKKKKLLELVDILTNDKNWPHFSDVFMISALKNNGIEDLRNYLLASAKTRDWEYSPETITDIPPEKLIERIVRSKFMDNLTNELPYVIKITTEHFGVSPDDSITSVVTVKCPSDRIGKLIMGSKGLRIKEIATAAEQDLCNAFRTTVRLKLVINFDEEKQKNSLYIKNK